MLLLGTGGAAVRLADALGATLIDADRNDLDEALEARAKDGVDLILFVACPDIVLRPRAFETLSDMDWREGVDQPLEILLRTFHAVGRCYPEAPPPIVLAGPSMALAGGDELALLAAASEGQRALMKSASRQWGKRGFRFTWIAIDTLLFAPEIEGAALPKSQDPDPLATGGPPTFEQLSALLCLLADPRARGMIGQTLILDGGELMLP